MPCTHALPSERTQMAQQAQDLDLKEGVGHPADIILCWCTPWLQQAPQCLAQGRHVSAVALHVAGIQLHNLQSQLQWRSATQTQVPSSLPRTER